jgi:dCMP deaminase
MTRLSREGMFMRMAILAANRGTCPRAQVGTVLVQDKRPIAIGYNGAPPGMPHCLDVGCEMVGDHCVRTVHAEANAVARAALQGDATEGAVLYTTYSPCRKCLELLAAAGVHLVMYMNVYHATPWDLAREMGVELKELVV